MRLTNCDVSIVENADGISSLGVRFWTPLHRDFRWGSLRMGNCLQVLRGKVSCGHLNVRRFVTMNPLTECLNGAQSGKLCLKGFSVLPDMTITTSNQYRYLKLLSYPTLQT